MNYVHSRSKRILGFGYFAVAHFYPSLLPSTFPSGWPMIPTPEKLFQECASSLQLARAAADALFGERHGYPIAVSLLSPIQDQGPDQWRVMVQVRHLLQEIRVPNPTACLNTHLALLLENGCAELEIQRETAWLTLRDAANLLREGRIATLVDEALTILREAGADPGEGQCHACLSPYSGPVYYDAPTARVARICSSCLDPQIQAAEAVRLGEPSADRRLTIAVIPSLLSGAAAWGFGWIGYEFLLGLLIGDRDEIHLPSLLIVAVIFGIGVAVGAAAAFPLRVRHRSYSMATMVAVLCGLGAIALGELVFAGWITHQAGDEVGRWKAYLIYWKGADGLRIMMRVFSAVGTVGFTIMFARPKLPAIKL